MKRALYRSLICLHPPSFRERFGDEMLCVFDEASGAGTARLFVDGLISLFRQWLFRSGVWKLALATATSSLVFVALGSSLTFSQRASINRHAHREADSQSRPMTALDRAKFSRSAVEAVAMLARFRREDDEKRRKARSTTRSPAVNPPADSHSDPS
jgi:hypothetical protein